MSLFDTVICDYPLPLPEFSEEELEDIKAAQKGELNWNEVEWQTKDMGGMLDVYTIEDDGQVYLRSTEWLQDGEAIKSTEGELEKFEHTGEYNFYNVILGEKYDHWIEFKATLWKGELKELNLAEYKKEDNTDRLKYQQKMHDEVHKTKSRGKLYKVYRLLVTKFFGAIRYAVGTVVNITWKLERWIP